LGEEEVLGIKAVMIEFEPIPPIRPKINDWYGIAWVDPALGQLLKVVAFEPDDYQTKRDFDKTIRGGTVDEVEAEYSSVTTVFTEKRNGLRVPGKVVLEHARHRWRKKPVEVKTVYQREQGLYVLREQPDGISRRRVLFRVEQSYHNYQFFSVRTGEEVRDYILRRSRHRSP
ncbi:MAG: hypothetical protein O7F11_00565, partial [Acidobacteria bacterium]|nr:hypothetical protein [Acidobacteriota bacterium]